MPESDWTDLHRATLGRLGLADRVDSFTATLLHAPSIVEAVTPMTRYVNEQSTLLPHHRLLLSMRTAWLDQSPAMWASQTARAVTQFPRTVGPLRGQAEGDRVAQTLQRLADELILTASVSNRTWESLANEHDVPWLMDAVETVAHQSFLCCLARSFGVAADSRHVASGAPLASLSSVWGRPPPIERQPPPAGARIEPIDGPKLPSSARSPITRRWPPLGDPAPSSSTRYRL